MTKKSSLLAIVVASLSCPPARAQLRHDTLVELPRDPRSFKIGEEAPIIPRALLFGNPERTSPKISPDGARLAWLAPVDGVLNVFVSPADAVSKGAPVTNDTGRGVRQFAWAFDNQRIVYAQDRGGDENWRICSVDLESGTTTDLTPFEGVQARIEKISRRFPSEILISLNDRDPRRHDLYRVDLVTARRTLVRENPGRVGRGPIGEWVADDDFTLRFIVRTNEDDGGMSLLAPDGEGWKEFLSVGREDALSTGPIDFGADGRTLFMTDSRGRDTAALVELDGDTAEVRVIHSWDDRADVSDWLIHPTEKRLQAASYVRERRAWIGYDATATDFERLQKDETTEVKVLSRTLDDRRWVIARITDAGPTLFYLYDRDARVERPLFAERPALLKRPLVQMRSERIRARDGLPLLVYYTLPINTQEWIVSRPRAPLPTVLLVHGGPWARDSWGYNPVHQMLANRGYAVLAVNFRGSTGFGKKFLNAGNREWAGKMHDDLLDAVDWAVRERIADPARIAIVGGSYGGYASLVGLTFSPDTFACAVDICGPSNLVTLLNTLPPHWEAIIQTFKDRVGDHTTDDGRAFLLSRSPLSFVDRIRRPLLIGQGANDPRVKQSESDQIVRAMLEKVLPVTYVVFPDEGHGFRRPPNSLAFWAVAEQFLAKHLGGKAEPIGMDFEGSTIAVPTGAEQIPGLPGALPTAPAPAPAP